MLVKELLLVPGFEAQNLSDGEREINGAYCGDLLSWVMSRAESSNAWITIMSNLNVIAVASITDVSCVILSEGVRLSEDELEAAREKGINILVSERSSFETAKILGSMI